MFDSLWYFALFVYILFVYTYYMYMYICSILSLNEQFSLEALETLQKMSDAWESNREKMHFIVFGKCLVLKWDCEGLASSFHYWSTKSFYYEKFLSVLTSLSIQTHWHGWFISLYLYNQNLEIYFFLLSLVLSAANGLR